MTDRPVTRPLVVEAVERIMADVEAFTRYQKATAAALKRHEARREGKPAHPPFDQIEP